MPQHSESILEVNEQAKLERLRAAAKEGFDAIERGDYTELHSEEELDAFLKEIHREVSTRMASSRRSA